MSASRAVNLPAANAVTAGATHQIQVTAGYQASAAPAKITSR